MSDLKSEKVVKSVDVRGQICPYPIIETRKALKEVKTGEVFEVITDNPPTANETLPHLCNTRKYPFEKLEIGAGVWKFFIRKTD